MHGGHAAPLEGGGGVPVRPRHAPAAVVLLVALERVEIALHVEEAAASGVRHGREIERRRMLRSGVGGRDRGQAFERRGRAGVVGVGVEEVDAEEQVVAEADVLAGLRAVDLRDAREEELVRLVEPRVTDVEVVQSGGVGGGLGDGRGVGERRVGRAGVVG